MKSRRYPTRCILSLCLPALLVAISGTGLHAQVQETRQYGAMKVSGPYTWRNLSIYLMHGEEVQPGRKLLTLQQALEQKLVVVRETGQVSQLTVENLSATEEIYIQSGDIVKGGRQDRTVSYDLVLAPRSGQVPLAAFCVESGRWTRRGSESDQRFESSNNVISTKELKLAAKRDKNQSRVWAGVRAAQEKLNGKLSVRVNAPESESSLQLTLENDSVEARVEECMRQLGGLAERHPDAVGFAFAIDGTMNSADVYATTTLFRALWPKMLRAAATESLVEGRTDTAVGHASIDSVVASLRIADSAAMREQTVGSTRAVTREGKNAILFETREEGREGWLHRNYIGGPMPDAGEDEGTMNRNVQERMIPNDRVPQRRIPRLPQIPQRRTLPRATPQIVLPQQQR